MIVYVGSIRAAKVDGTRDALAAMASVDESFASVEIRAVDLGEAGPGMPMSEAAIVAGAETRARALVDRIGPSVEREPVYCVGLEGGLDPVTIGGVAHIALRSWACVTDSRRWGYGAGGVVLVPDRLAADVADGRELGDVIDRLVGEPVRGTRGAWGVLTRDLITRREAFRVAVISAFAPFLNPGLYGSA